MTFKELQAFALKHKLEIDDHTIFIKEFSLYKDGYIYINYRTTKATFSYLVASGRTEKQMQQFIESLL